MFTGLIAGVGEIVGLVSKGDSSEIAIKIPNALFDIKEGDSISVNGVCLTVKEINFNDNFFTADVMGITLNITNLGEVKLGEKVNLELALKSTDRLGGHLVQGHVDATSSLLNIENRDNWSTYTFNIPAGKRRYFVDRGSIALNGISLTISCVSDDTFQVSIIPTTYELTNIKQLTIGARVNLEIDLIAKYVESLLRTQE